MTGSRVGTALALVLFTIARESATCPAVSAQWIVRQRQPAPFARRVRLSRKGHAGSQHAFEPAHPVAHISNLLTHPRQIDRCVPHPLVEQDDLAQRPDRIAIEAHAAVDCLRRRIAGSRFAGVARLSAILR